MRHILIPVLAFAIGGAVGVFATKKFFEVKYARISEEEIESVRIQFGRQLIRRPMEPVPIIPENPVEDGGYSKSSIDYSRLGKGPRRNYGGLSFPQGSKELTPEEKELLDAVRESDDNDVPEPPELELTGNPDPYVISEEKFSNECDHFEKLGVLYYTKDDVVADDDGDIKEDIDETIGWDCFKVLERQSTAWVRNETIGIDYEIVRVDGAYKDIVGGEGWTLFEVKHGPTKVTT